MTSTTQRRTWTTAEIDALKAAVASTKQQGKPISEAFEVIAKERSTSAGAVQAKWYSMQPPVRKKNKRTAKATAAPIQPKKRTMKAKGKAKATPNTVRDVVFQQLHDFAAKKTYCDTCETTYTGKHTTEDCRDSLRMQLTKFRSLVSKVVPQNGSVKTLIEA